MATDAGRPCAAAPGTVQPPVATGTGERGPPMMDLLMLICTLIAAGALGVGAYRGVTGAGSFVRAAGMPLLVWAACAVVMTVLLASAWGWR